jgi:hypothetical protein
MSRRICGSSGFRIVSDFGAAGYNKYGCGDGSAGNCVRIVVLNHSRLSGANALDQPDKSPYSTTHVYLSWARDSSWSQRAVEVRAGYQGTTQATRLDVRRWEATLETHRTEMRQFGEARFPPEAADTNPSVPSPIFPAPISHDLVARCLGLRMGIPIMAGLRRTRLRSRNLYVY